MSDDRSIGELDRLLLSNRARLTVMTVGEKYRAGIDWFDARGLDIRTEECVGDSFAGMMDQVFSALSPEKGGGEPTADMTEKPLSAEDVQDAISRMECVPDLHTSEGSS